MKDKGLFDMNYRELGAYIGKKIGYLINCTLST